jgi:hypothetical protein
VKVVVLVIAVLFENGIKKDRRCWKVGVLLPNSLLSILNVSVFVGFDE